MMQKMFLRIPVLLAVLSALGIYLCGGDAVAESRTENFSVRPSTDTRIVKLADRNKQFMIPRNYLTGLWTNPDGSSTIVGMASMPEFSGAENSNFDCFFFGRNRECRLVQFVYRGSLNWGPDEYRHRFENLVGRDSSQEDFDYGLQTTLLPNAYVFVGPTDQETIFIYCNVFSKICSMSIDLEGGRWQVQMNVDFLSQWENILKKFREFMSPRIVDAR
jgi:hypothetical protein